MGGYWESAPWSKSHFSYLERTYFVGHSVHLLAFPTVWSHCSPWKTKLMCFTLQWAQPLAPCIWSQTMCASRCWLWHGGHLPVGGSWAPSSGRKWQSQMMTWVELLTRCGCPVGDNLSGDACVSGIVCIWLKAKIRVRKKLAAKGWLALGVKGGAAETPKGGSPYLSAPVCSTCRYGPVAPATTLLSVIFVPFKKPAQSLSLRSHHFYLLLPLHLVAACGKDFSSLKQNSAAGLPHRTWTFASGCTSGLCPVEQWMLGPVLTEALPNCLYTWTAYSPLSLLTCFLLSVAIKLHCRC